MKQINLLPRHQYQRSRKQTEFILLFSGVLLLNFLLLGWIHSLIFNQVQKLNYHKNQLVEQLRFVSSSVENLRQVKQQYERLQATRNNLDVNHEQMRKILALLNDLNLLAPPRFFIKTISWEMPYLSLVGVAQSEINFSNLIKKLEKKYHFHFKCNGKKNKNLLFEFRMNIRI